MIKKLSLEAIEFLLKLLNKIFNTGSFPATWREYYIVFITKANTQDFRPITLANTFLKIFEKIIYNRLDWWSYNLKIIPDFQFGFCKGKSTDDSLVILTTEINLAFEKNSRLGALFLDIKGTFDNVNPAKLHQMLIQLGLPTKIARFILYITSKRMVKGYINGVPRGKNNN